MKPNTLVMGFYDNSYPDDYFQQDPAFTSDSSKNEDDEFGVDLPSLQAHFGPVRDDGSPRSLAPDEYVGIISDAIKMNKNVCLGRYFHQLDPGVCTEKRGLRTGDGAGCTIDVWPLNPLRPGSSGYADVCSLFLLQMACILNMAGGWRRARIRIFLCAEAQSEDQSWREKEDRFRELLKKLRIRAEIKVVAWDVVVRLLGTDSDTTTTTGHLGELNGLTRPPQPITQEFLSAVNGLLKENSAEATVRFLYLPRPPAASEQYQQYLAQLDTLSRDLGPTLLIHGLTPVTCTEL